ncbi:MAG: SGNH/GDSL hydrolase family protein [Candidatus Saccharimonadaceae bacterium]
MGSIKILGENSRKEACIFGTSTSIRLARYRGVLNTFSYAIAYPTDSSFLYVEGLCPGFARCVYGYTNDTLVMQVPRGSNEYKHDLISNFTNYIRRSSTKYVFDYDGPYNHIAAEERTVPTGIVSVSSNGRWSLVEIVGYGFIRIDLRSLEHKRIVAYDSLPIDSTKPLESTISNDGRLAAIVGYDSGVLLYEINDNCGDVLTDAAIEYFSEGTTPCDSASIGLSTLFSGFLSAHVPRFSADGKRLLLDIRTQTKFLTATFAPGPQYSTNPYYLSFGDSFSSGEGELSDSFYLASTNTALNHCHVSTRSYPYLLGSFRHTSTSNLACSGSRTTDVQQASRAFQFGANSTLPTVVSLGVGGNDVDFMGKLKSCIGVGTCEWAKEGNRKTTAYEIQGLFPKMVDIITELKTNFSPASFFLVGYPDVINSQANASCSSLVSALLDASERRYMSESIKYLNVVLRAAATYAKVSFVDIEDAYQGERLCDQNETAMNSIRYGDDFAPIAIAPNLKLIGAESFHPTPKGHQLAALIIDRQLNSSWMLPICSGCQFSESQLAVTGYWLENTNADEPTFRQLATAFLKSDFLVDVSSVAFSFLPNMFAPHSLIRFELHSDPQLLGDFTSEEDGSVKGSLNLPSISEGYHVVHAYGESYSGEKIDVYQTLYIGTSGQDNKSAMKQSIDTVASSQYEVRSNTEIEGSNGQAITVVQNITASKNISNAHKMNSKLSDSIIWWYVFCLGGIGLVFLLISWLLSIRKNKSLPSEGD